jgi:dCMP deaminase
MDIALMVATRSGDPDTQVGAVLVTKDNRIISTGYNHYPAGYPEEREDWSRPNKYAYVVHAEMNAIAYAKQDISEATLYVTLSPCSNCAKLISSSGIKRVVFLEERPDVVSSDIFKNTNVSSFKKL